MLLQHIARRLLLTIPTVIGVITTVFILVRILPGDPVQLLAGEQTSVEVIERLKREFGLDQPIYIQYINYLTGVFRLDFGFSFRTQAPALTEISARLPNTLLLATASITIAVLAGILAGVISATRQNSKQDYAVMSFAVFGVSLPNFWQGLMLILIFSVWLHVLPSGGVGTPLHLVLPAITLASTPIALIARMTRSSLLDVLRQDYVRTARAKGLIEAIVIYRHAFKNALIPVTTVIGLYFGFLLGGAVVTESVFAWPGIGRLLIESIFARDYVMVQAIILIYAFLFMIVNLATDIVYSVIDVRIRFD